MTENEKSVLGPNVVRAINQAYCKAIDGGEPLEEKFARMVHILDADDELGFSIRCPQCKALPRRMVTGRSLYANVWARFLCDQGDWWRVEFDRLGQERKRVMEPATTHQFGSMIEIVE